MKLLQNIGDQFNISPALVEQIFKNLKISTFAKGDILLKEGNICKHVYFIHKGALRFFYINENGNDITHWFAFEGDFITEVNSFYTQASSSFYIETMENCELIAFSLEKIQLLSDKYPEFNKLEKKIYRKSIIEMGQKIMDLQFRDARTRYDNLVKKQEDILLRVPLGHIASYLGITQPSLSRIRQQRIKNTF